MRVNVGKRIFNESNGVFRTISVFSEVEPAPEVNQIREFRPNLAEILAQAAAEQQAAEAPPAYNTGDWIVVTEENHPLWRAGQQAVLAAPSENGWMANFNGEGEWFIHNSHFALVVAPVVTPPEPPAAAPAKPKRIWKPRPNRAKKKV